MNKNSSKQDKIEFCFFSMVSNKCAKEFFVFEVCIGKNLKRQFSASKFSFYVLNIIELNKIFYFHNFIIFDGLIHISLQWRCDSAIHFVRPIPYTHSLQYPLFQTHYPFRQIEIKTRKSMGLSIQKHIH